ncbi:MAG TPA: TSUP family transporter [Burkholderiaceae bacterium]|jgi:uncharacterized membrane protein YfcA|nr:TSUP family transporter [Burkholderiaceae bacterium]
MTLSVLIVSALGLATLVTSFISGILGMAGGMILMGVFLAFLPVPSAMLLHGIAQLSANGGRALLLRRQIDWRVAAGYAAGAAVALGLFAVARLVVGKPAALIVIGLTPLVALALPESLHLNVERRWHPFACGIVCLGLSLAAGIAGPILDLFFVRSKMSRHATVATKAATQSLSHLIKIVYFGSVVAVQGTEVRLWLAAALVPLAFAGTQLSRQVLERMTDESFRRWTRWTVTSLGAIYLVSGVSMLLRHSAGAPL